MVITKAQAAGGSGIAVLGAGGTAAGTVLGNKGDDSVDIQPTDSPSVAPVALIDDNIPKTMPDYTILALEDNFDEYLQDSVGEKYGWYLTGTYGSFDEDKLSNKDWWIWSYENWKRDFKNRDYLSYEFIDESKIKSAYADKDSKDPNAKYALNKVCEAFAHKGINGYDDDEEVDLFRYCSPLEEIPKTIKQTKETTYSGHKGSFAESNPYFVSVNDSSNDLFWKLRNYEFFWIVDENKSSFVLDKDKDLLFYEHYEGNFRDNPDNSVKHVCGQAYFLDPSNSEGKVDYSTLMKFCYWN